MLWSCIMSRENIQLFCNSPTRCKIDLIKVIFRHLQLNGVVAILPLKMFHKWNKSVFWTENFNFVMQRLVLFRAFHHRKNDNHEQLKFRQITTINYGLQYMLECRLNRMTFQKLKTISVTQAYQTVCNLYLQLYMFDLW